MRLFGYSKRAHLSLGFSSVDYEALLIAKRANLGRAEGTFVKGFF